VTKSNALAGYFRSGLPYNRLGQAPRPLVVFQGLMFENKPQTGMLTGIYKFLGNDYSAYVVLRKPGMPPGYTLKDMADDYATMIREEFGGPVDVIGVSTGGSIVHHFAADHPDLVRRLVIHSAAYTLSDEAKRLQLQVGHLAQQHQWRKAYAVLIDSVLSHSGWMGIVTKPAVWLISWLMSLNAPKDPTDLVVTVEAEDKFNFKARLAEISAPTLVIAGTKDPFYTVQLFRETAEGIPNARLILYEGMGHPASGKQFGQDVLAFLKEGSPETA
jgi:pimeloyl-ACP methyl ester carboxylesterase